MTDTIELTHGDRLRHPAAGTTSLYLVRHGQTGSNVQRTLCGMTDVPLTPHGTRQARLIGERLQRETGIDALISSPLQRAMTTAWSIGERIGLEPIPLPGLVEMNFGALELATLEQVAATHPELARRLADIDDDDLTWPDGESRRQFRDRVQASFAAILTYYAAHRVIVVAHGGVIGAFLAQLRGLSPNDPRTYEIVNCSLTHLEIGAERTRVHLFNDTAHLAAAPA